ncbi:hypothetical protein J6W20_06310 [bacterium]|nr:hypothetical protein [bacterium]
MTKALLLNVNSKYALYVSFEDMELTGYFLRETNQELTSFFVESLQSFCQIHHCNPIEIEYLYFVNGPGSFTNIRLSTLLVKTLLTLHPHLQIKETDLLTFSMDKKNKEIVYLQSSKTTYFVLIHDKEQVLISTKLVEVDQFNQYQSQYPDYLVKNVDDQQEIVNQINRYDFNLDSFKLTDLNNLKANYMKDPNITLKKQPDNK